MLSPIMATCGAVAFILGSYFHGRVRWRWAGAWLASVGVFVLLLVLNHVWIPMDRSFSTEPLFIGVWIALPMLWSYRNCSILVPLQELLTAFGWSLIAILISFLALPRIPESLVNIFAFNLAPDAIEPAVTLILAITLPTVFLAALETDRRLNPPNRPYIFGLAFAVFFIGLTSLLGKPFPEKMEIVDFLLLNTALLVVIRLRAAIHTAWIRVLLELLLWFALVIVTLTII